MKAQNTFSGGLNMDVNSLIAPNNILSNCLNGTLITYNGNEGVLQNDMGNAKVYKAQLPSGWVPVGMQEYGGIIYVASYNPESKQSLLGSFPSPQQRFENNNSGEETLFTSLRPGKYKLFTKDNKDMELKPGNKIAISLGYKENDETHAIYYTNIEPNYNKIYTHKRHWSVQLCLLTANGLLSDITNNLKTLVDPSKALENNTEYANYFFLQSYIPDNLEPYLRVYDGNLIGSPYILVIENLASSMDTFITSSFVQHKLKFIVACNIKSSSQLLGVDPEGLSGFYYTYTSSKGLKGEGFKSMHETKSTLFIGTSKEELDSKVEQLINCGISLNNLIIDKDTYTIVQKSNYTILNIDELNYILNITDSIEIPNVNDDDVITLTINPCFFWDGEYTPLDSLEFIQLFDVNKIGTGIHRINQWRYYYNTDFITLTWGMESYPAEGEAIKSVSMLFLDYSGTPIDFGDTKLEFNYFSYNGEFTQVLETSLFKKIPYIVKIKWLVGGKLMEEDRWLIATPLFNDFYSTKLVQDFYLDWNVTDNGKEMAKLASLEEVKLEVIGDPQEHFTSEDWSTFNLILLEEPSSNTIQKSNTYEYLLSTPQVLVTEDFDIYPFKLLLGDIEDYKLQVDSHTGEVTIADHVIKHVLTTEHKITYDFQDLINVNKQFETYYNPYQFTLHNANAYIALIATREHHGSGSSDDNWSILNVFGNLLEEVRGLALRDFISLYVDTNSTSAREYMREFLERCQNEPEVLAAYNEFLANQKAKGELEMDLVLLYYKHTNANAGISLVDDPEVGSVWENNITSRLNKLAGDVKDADVIIPVLIICKAYGNTLALQNEEHVYRWALNWAVRTDNHEWCLYWNEPKCWQQGQGEGEGEFNIHKGGLPDNHIDYDDPAVQYLYLDRIFPDTIQIPPTIYEARSNSNYLRCTKFNEYISGYLAQNDPSEPILYDKDSPFNFSEHFKIACSLVFPFSQNQNYNDFIEDKYISLVQKSLQDDFRELLKFKYEGQYITESGIHKSIIKNYEFNNIIPGTLDIIQKVNNTRLLGIDTLVGYSPNNDGKVSYVIPNKELYPDIVYQLKINNNSIEDYVEVPELGVLKINGIYHIVPKMIGKHYPLVISCPSDGRSYMDFTGVPTSNIENII